MPHHRFDGASCERKLLLGRELADFWNGKQEVSLSADNVGILCMMIHFSGVLIGKKTDKFYLLRRVEKMHDGERNL